MKRKLSVTVENGTVSEMEKLVIDGRFRNKSHLIEFAVKKLMKENKNGKKA